MNLTIDIKDSTGSVVGTAEVTKHAGEYQGVFLTGETRFVSRVRVEDCDVWSLITALLKEAQSE